CGPGLHVQRAGRAGARGLRRHEDGTVVTRAATEIATTMRIARYYANSTVLVESIPRPEIADGEVLVRVMACGICGSDTLEWFRLPKSPRILGHEISGVVAQSRSDS